MKFQMLAVLTLIFPVALEAQSAARVEVKAEGRTEIRGRNAEVAGEEALRANAAASLPDAPVRRAIAEAEGRGATRAEIDRSAMETHTRLKVSREILSSGRRSGRGATVGEVTAGAEAMAAGASHAELVRIREAAPAERGLSASLSALTRLHLRGLGGMEAAAAIAARLEQGTSDNAIASLAASARSTSELATSMRSGASSSADAAAGLGAAVQAGGATLGATGSVSSTLSGGIFR